MIFIPTLLFESGYNCDFYVFKRNIVNVLLLAFPGVLMGSIMLGWCIHTFLYRDWDWAPCLMFGAIVSATDPVAVVALLKSLGASAKF